MPQEPGGRRDRSEFGYLVVATSHCAGNEVPMTSSLVLRPLAILGLTMLVPQGTPATGDAPEDTLFVTCRELRPYCPWPAGLVLFRVSGVRHSDGGDAQTGRLANLREHRLPFCGLARRREFFDGVSKRTDSRKVRKRVEAC